MTTDETTPIPRTHAERKEESERKIIDAACELFAKKGYSQTSLSEIGRVAGYTGSLVGHRFGSKEGLLHAVVRHLALHLTEQPSYELTEDASGRESISQYIDLYLSEYVERQTANHALYTIIGEAISCTPEILGDIQSLNHRRTRKLIEAIERGIRAGEFREDLNVDLEAFLIGSLLRGIVLQFLLEAHMTIDLREIIVRTQEQVLANLSD